MEKNKKEIGGYILGKTIGSGTFGKVKLAQHKETHQMVAIKILEKQRIIDVSDVERVTREIHILKTVRHPNINQLYQIIETPKYLFLIMQYIQNGELFHYIVNKRAVNELDAVRIFHQLLDALEYIHKLGIVHRDLKPENLLLDYKNNLKIVDFGLSNTYTNGQKLKTPCGSPCYAAPEMVKGLDYRGIDVDIWSSGIILYTMVYGYLPFEDEDTPELYRKIRDGNYALPALISSEARDLLRQIIEVEPSKRLNIGQIRNHPWMKKGNNHIPTPGIVFGYNKVPIEKTITSEMQSLGYQPEVVIKNIEINRHSNVTTVYYLLLKKYLKGGGVSSADLSDPNFDRTLLQPFDNRSRKAYSALGYLSESKRGSSKLGAITERNSVNSNRKRSTKSQQKRQSSKQSQIKYKKSSLKPKKQKVNYSPQGPYRINRKYRQKFNVSLMSKDYQKQQNSMGSLSITRNTPKSASKKKKSPSKISRLSKQLYSEAYTHKNTARSTKQSIYLQKINQNHLQPHSIFPNNKTSSLKKKYVI